MTPRRLATIFSAFALLAACADAPGTTAEPQRTENPIGFDLRLTDGAPSTAPFTMAAAVSDGTAMTVTSATINVGEIAFKSAPGMCREGERDGMGGPGMGDDDGRDGDRERLRRMDAADATTEPVWATCGGEGFVVVPGPFRIDLLTGASEPPLGSLSIYAGTYRWVDLRLAPVTDENDPMNGISVEAFGSFSTGTTVAVPVHIAMDISNPPLRIRPVEGIVVAPEGGIDLVVALSAKDWFEGVADGFDTCVQQENAPFVDGVLQVTGQTNTACDSVNGKLRQNFIGAGERARVRQQSKSK